MLDDRAVGEPERLAALARLEAAGRLALSPIIARLHLGDDPLVLTRLPAPTRTVPDPTSAGPLPLSAVLEGVLYAILDGGPPQAQGALGPAEPARYVADWDAWWAEHKQDDLPTMRAWAEQARARAQSSFAAEVAGGRAATPAPAGPSKDMRPDPEDAAVQLFAQMQTLLIESLDAKRDRCFQAETIAAGHLGLVRHAAHACWRMQAALRRPAGASPR